MARPRDTLWNIHPDSHRGGSPVPMPYDTWTSAYPYPYHMACIRPYTWRGSHAHARAQAVGWGGRESAGKSGKKWERGLPSALFGGEGISVKANGGWERGAWTDRRTVPSLPLVPYSFPISPFRSLFVPHSFPIFTQISPHFPTWARICARISLFPYRFSHLDIPVRLYLSARMHQCASTPVPICTLIHPYIPWWIPMCMPGWTSLPTPWCTPVYTIVYAWVPTWMPSRADPHGYTPGFALVCLGTCLGVRMGMCQGVCIKGYTGMPAWTHPCLPTRMYPPVDTHLPTCIQVHPPICTVKRPSVRPWIWVHGSREASHPHTTDIPTNTPGRTVICVATSGKRGGPIGKKRGGPSYGRADRPMDWGVRGPMHVHVEVHPALPFWEKMGVSVRMVGWVGGKNGGLPGKKGGRSGKTPARWGKMVGGPWREGRDPPGGLGEPMERARLYGARRDAFGEGDGNSPVRHAPVALRYPKSLPGGIGEYLGAPGCTHTTTRPPVCTCGDRYLFVPRPAGVSSRLSWQPETGNSQTGIPLRCARGNYDAHARQPPSRMRGFLYPYHGSSSLGSPIHFGLCHLSQCAMYLDIALPGGSGRL